MTIGHGTAATDKATDGSKRSCGGFGDFARCRRDHFLGNAQNGAMVIVARHCQK
jgi:hypothetical protein